jgi:beta-lactamase regulating signal transducer with metallopeptidase domain
MNMLENLFRGTLTLSLYASVVALVVLLIKAVCGKRLSPDFHYGIWFLVVFKLLFPWDIKSMFSIFTWLQRLIPAAVTEKVNTVMPPANAALVQPPVVSPPNFSGEMPAANGIGPWSIAAGIWLIGIVLMLTVLLFSYHKTNKTLKLTAKKPDARLLNLLAACRSELQLRSRVQLRTSDSFRVPFIFGFVKPRIILPASIDRSLADEGIQAILSHELMHIKRKDYVVNLLLFLLKAVYWFNPVVWFALALLQNDGERACDSAVVKNYPAARRGEYAKALLDVAVGSGGRQNFIPAVSAFIEGDFKGRVKNVIKARKYSLLASFIAVAVIIAAGIVLLPGALATGGNPAPGTAVAANQDQTAEAAVKDLVDGFGKKLQSVSLLAPAAQVQKSMQENYGDYVAPELLAKWTNDPQNAPGKTVSSPWPDRIEISGLEKLADSAYRVQGEIIEITSVEKVNGGVAAKQAITLDVSKVENRWLITAVQLGAAANGGTPQLTPGTSPTGSESSGTKPAAGSIVYQNTQYGFNFTLPASWQGYSLVTATWQGLAVSGTEAGNVVQTGPQLSIRHPQWTAQNPRQDIPILILTLAQWNSLQKEEFHIGAAPIGPKELGRNSRYVFALPARYNFAFPTGFEEVEKILDGNPLQAY